MALSLADRTDSGNLNLENVTGALSIGSGSGRSIGANQRALTQTIGVLKYFFLKKKKKKEKRPAVNRCIFTILLPVSFELLFFQVK